MVTYKFALRDIAQNKGLNSNQVAGKVHMSRQAVSMLMRPDVQQVRVETISKLCAGLDVTPAELYVPAAPDAQGTQEREG